MSIPGADLALTAQGQALKAKIEAGEGAIPLHITRIVTGSGTSNDPLNLTAVVDERQEFTLTGSRAAGPRTTIDAVLTNSGIAEGYSMFQIGFYALDPDAGEILYRISQFPEPNYVPSETERGFTYQPSFNIITGNAGEVTLNIELSGVATPQAVYGSIEMSGSPVPDAGTRLHLLVIKDVPGYVPSGGID